MCVNVSSSSFSSYFSLSSSCSSCSSSCSCSFSSFSSSSFSSLITLQIIKWHNHRSGAANTRLRTAVLTFALPSADPLSGRRALISQVPGAISEQYDSHLSRFF